MYTAFTGVSTGDTHLISGPLVSLGGDGIAHLRGVVLLRGRSIKKLYTSSMRCIKLQKKKRDCLEKEIACKSGQIRNDKVYQNKVPSRRKYNKVLYLGLKKSSNRQRFSQKHFQRVLF